jgi:hypothetical protein
MLSSHLRLDIPSGLLPPGLPTKNCKHLSPPPQCYWVTCQQLLISPPDQNNLIGFFFFFNSLLQSISDLGLP